MQRRGPFGRGIGWSGLEQSGDLDATSEGPVSLKKLFSVSSLAYLRVPLREFRSLRAPFATLLAGKCRLWNQVQRAEQFPVVIDAGIGGREKFVAVKNGIGSGE